MLAAPSRHSAQRASRVALGLTVPTLLASPTAHFLVAQEVRIDPREIVTLLPKDVVPAIRDPAPLPVPTAHQAR